MNGSSADKKEEPGTALQQRALSQNNRYERGHYLEGEPTKQAAQKGCYLGETSVLTNRVRTSQQQQSERHQGDLT